METEKDLNTEEQISNEPKKSKRKLYALIALAVAVIIYFLVPSGAPTVDEEEGSDVTSSQSSFENGTVNIVSFEYDSKIIRKSVISGTVSNTSDSPIESVEFEAVFSDNTEFVIYDEFIKAGERNHQFSVKVTGHKGASLDALKIREVQKAK